MPWRRQHPAFAAPLSALLLLGCGVDSGPPTGPPPDQPPPAPYIGDAFIWGHVVDESGVCILGATVEIVSGPGAGREAVQETICNAWDYAAGFEFRGLPLGVTVTLRASRDGYEAQERSLVTGRGGPPFQFWLTPE